jgi:hypothetical protein
MIRNVLIISVGFLTVAVMALPAIAEQIFNKQVIPGARAEAEPGTVAAILKEIRSGKAQKPVFVAAPGSVPSASMADFEPRTAQELQALVKVINAPKEEAFEKMRIAALAHKANMVRQARFEDMRQQSMDRQQRARFDEAALRADQERARLRQETPIDDGPISEPVPTADRPLIYVPPGQSSIPKVFTDFR